MLQDLLTSVPPVPIQAEIVQGTGQALGIVWGSQYRQQLASRIQPVQNASVALIQDLSTLISTLPF